MATHAVRSATHAVQKKRRPRKTARRLVQTISLATAATLVPVAAFAATTHSQTSGSPSSTLDLSPNPVLTSGLNGYSVQEGGTGLQRVAVSDHVAASWAAKVTSTATTTRIREPNVGVQPGATWTFASDVKAGTGAKAQITVSWYSQSGAFLSWTGGTAQSVTSSSWTRVAAALPVPAGAATAQTVVNVLGTANSAPSR